MKPLWAFLIIVTTPSLAQATAPRTLADMENRYRPLLIFAPSHEIQGKLTNQVKALESHRKDMLDRHIVLVPSFAAHCGVPETETVTLMPSEWTVLRRRFHIHPNDFTVILLGKDGGEKLRSHTPVTIEQLNRIIDAMPMRQEEMRERPR